MLNWSNDRVFSVGWQTSRNEQNLIAERAINDLLRDGKVSYMDGVKRATKKAKIHLLAGVVVMLSSSRIIRYSRTWPLPRTMNFWQVSSSKPMGPRAWMRVVLMPISAPNPN